MFVLIGNPPWANIPENVFQDGNIPWKLIQSK